MDRLHQRGFAHAARAPQQRIIGGQPPGETLGVLHQQIAHQINAPQQGDIHPVHPGHRREAAGCRMPDKGVRRIEIDRSRGLGSQPVKGAGDALEGGEQGLGGGGVSGHGAFLGVRGRL
jgi:hypothetical protein